MPYSESNTQQNERLATQYARVNRYLATVGDSAEAERRALWVLPAEVNAAAYPDYIRPFRARVQQMLAYPPPGEPLPAAPQLTEIGSDDDGVFYRVHLPLLKEGLDANGLLIRPHPERRAPDKALAVAIHGGGGTPEMAAGILEGGSWNYNEMGRRCARRGHTVWMPACYERITLDAQPATPPPDMHSILDRKARLVGSTLSAIDAYAIIAGTEALLAMDIFGTQEAIAIGLSYGGFRALEVAALSERFVACISSCYFNDRRTLMERYAEVGGFHDWFFNDLLRVATDVELCRLICPRPLFIEVGATDELFPVDGATRTAAAVQALYAGLGISECFGFDAFTGNHEFSGEQAFAFLDRLGL